MIKKTLIASAVASVLVGAFALNANADKGGFGFKSSGSRRDNTDPAEWKGPIDALNARESGTVAGGASYQRPVFRL